MSDQAFEIVKTAIEELADEMGFDQLRSVKRETELFGGSAGIDSLSLVRLVAEIERAAEAVYGRNVVLADERAMSRRNSPFRTVGTLADFVAERVNADA